MQYVNLLEKEDSYLFRILRWLELKKNTYIHINELCEVFSISKFKAKQFIYQLQELLEFEGYNTTIFFYDSGEIEVNNLETLLVKKVLLQLAERSLVFKLYRSIFEEEKSLSEFREMEFISKTKSYELKKELEQLVQHESWKIEKNTITGDELQLRKAAYAVYYEIFGGIKYPFELIIQEKVMRIIDEICSLFSIHLTKTNEIKLFYFLSVMSTRLENNHFINESYHETFQVEVELISDNPLEKFYGTKNHDLLTSEWKLLLLFMYTEEILINIEYPHFRFYFKEPLMDVINKHTDEIFVAVRKDSLLDEEYQELKEQFRKSILRTHLNLALFYYSLESFTLENSFFFFEETYPLVTRIVPEIINTTFKDRLDNRAKVRIYYDYLFAFLRIVPVNLVEETIYVCVDFSQGFSYTTFIIEQILQFKNLNIEIQDRVTAKTELFISDLAVSTIGCKQIIWKKPPTSEDWKLFGDFIVEIKNRKK